MSGVIGGAGSKSGVIGKTEIDYEEGTWTAIFKDNTGATIPTANVTNNECSYVKVGRVVLITGRLVTDSVTALGSGEGIYITGLPFTSKSDNSGASCIPIGYCASIAVTAGTTVTGRVSNNSKNMSLFKWNEAGGVSSLTAGEWTSNGQMQFGGTYQSNS